MIAKTNKSFLKWAGGKSQMAKTIYELKPQSCSRLVEPFVGSASVALNVPASKYLLADVNRDLISVYQNLVEHGTPFIRDCQELFCQENNTEEAYIRMRKEFNTTSDVPRKACLFVYLNRHCFNGLMRYNAKGGFNTPFGRYSNPRVSTLDMRRFLSQLNQAEFVVSDFRPIMEQAGCGDFVYCDPPYVPLNETGFTAYAKGGFPTQDHADLVVQCLEAAKRGAVVAVSNHDNKETRALYKFADRIVSLQVKRTIGANGESRSAASELIAIYGNRESSVESSVESNCTDFVQQI